MAKKSKTTKKNTEKAKSSSQGKTRLSVDTLKKLAYSGLLR